MKPIDFRSRLDALTRDLGGHALLQLAPPEFYRNSDVEHPWRQDSFLYYLTGLAEPESAVLVCPYREAGDRYHVFLRDKDAGAELWTGRRLGVAEARKTLAVDEVHPIGELWSKGVDLLKGAEGVYYSAGLSEEADLQMLRALDHHKRKFGKRGLGHRLPLHDATEMAGRMRSRKGPEELERMRYAARITRSAFERIIAETSPGMNERQVYGTILAEFYKGGAEMEAYGSIVAGGDNACVLHYRDNSAALTDGRLLLVDAGAQFEYYASDVTRTFPVGSRFTPAQKALYETVLAAQKQALEAARPGGDLVEIHSSARRKLAEGLKEIGLLDGSVDEIIEQDRDKKYFPHGTSHWLGMDVHDVGRYYEGGQPVKLEPGMCFTVEPGLYVPPEDPSAPEEMRGTGIRIEDDVAVTEGGSEVLTEGIPKEVRDLES